MKLLLDTHVMLWFVMGDSRLSKLARELIEDQSNEKLFSIASVWEIAIKTSIGKLQLDEPIDILPPKAARSLRYQYLDVSIPHACRVAVLPFHHRDPFDRLLVSQCLSDALPLVSSESIFDPYGIQRSWK